MHVQAVNPLPRACRCRQRAGALRLFAPVATALWATLSILRVKRAIAAAGGRGGRPRGRIPQPRAGQVRTVDDCSLLIGDSQIRIRLDRQTRGRAGRSGLLPARGHSCEVNLDNTQVGDAVLEQLRGHRDLQRLFS